MFDRQDNDDDYDDDDENDCKANIYQFIISIFIIVYSYVKV